jgi:hypothetical protein
MRTIATTLFALLILWGAGDLQAQQNSYYWSGGQKITLEQDRSTAVLVYKDAAATQGQALAARIALEPDESHFSCGSRY